MVIRRTKCSEHQPEKNEEVRPTFQRIDEMPVAICGVIAKQEREAPDSNQCEGQIGSHIAKIRNAEETTVIRELMVGKWLWNAWDQTTGDGDHNSECD
jgi:hypothetical protein